MKEKAYTVEELRSVKQTAGKPKIYCIQKYAEKLFVPHSNTNIVQPLKKKEIITTSDFTIYSSYNAQFQVNDVLQCKL